VAARYADAVRLLSAAPLSGYLPTVWLELVRCKRHHYESMARYYLATALLMATVVHSSGTLDMETRQLINSHSRVAETGARKAMYADSVIGTRQGRKLLGILKAL